jgi:death-on-curing protein
MTPAFLSFDEIIEIHADQISQYGGSMGNRDRGLPVSAVGQPTASFGGHFLHEDVFEMASAYLFSLVNNHPFIDGNKRVDATAAGVFLKINGYRIRASNDELAELVLGVAQGLIDKPAVAEFFRSRASSC